MIQMQAQQNVGGIAGLAVLTPTVHGDDRGYFMETYNQRDMESLGFHYDFVQDNQSGSSQNQVAQPVNAFLYPFFQYHCIIPFLYVNIRSFVPSMRTR